MQIPAALASFYSTSAKDAGDQRSARNRLSDQSAVNTDLAIELRVGTQEVQHGAETFGAIAGGIDTVLGASIPFLPKDTGEAVGHLQGQLSEMASGTAEAAAERDAWQAEIVGCLTSGRDQVAQQSSAEALAEVISRVA